MSTPKAAYGPEFCTHAGYGAVVAELLAEPRTTAFPYHRIERRVHPVPRLDWPSDLFKDAVCN